MDEGEEVAVCCWPPPDDVPVTPEDEEGDRKALRLSSDEGNSTGTPAKRRRCCSVLRHQQEALADVALARWWRRCGRYSQQYPGETGSPPASCNPNTRLRVIASERCVVSYGLTLGHRTEEGKTFMNGEIARLRGLLTSDWSSPSVHAALGSFYAKLARWPSALTHLQTAVALDGSDKQCCHLLERVKRQILVLQTQAKLLLHVNVDNVFPAFSEVDRRSTDALSFSEFLFSYALRGRPVVITGLVDQMTSQPWSIQHIRRVAGDCRVTLKRPVSGSPEWAQLEDAEVSSVADFVDGLTSQAAVSASQRRYLFDWSLPLHCPALAHQLTVPKYFAGDFLQRMPPGSLYRDSWPSLFLAPAGLTSELHVDAFGSNFWMALFEGRKRWTFFSREDQPALYPTYDYSMDASFAADIDNPDLHAHPLLTLTTPMQCVLQPGELLFVPAGSPHRVENLDSSLAISANFVDLSNLRLVCEELSVNALIDDRAAALLHQLTSTGFIAKMDKDITNTTWSEFKHWPKECAHFDY